MFDTFHNLVAALPSSAIIDSVWLNLLQEGGEGDSEVAISPVTRDWTEGQVKWNNQPSVGSPLLSRFCSTSTGIVQALHNVPIRR